MTVKQKILKAIRGLPDDVTFEDVIERLYSLYSIDRGPKPPTKHTGHEWALRLIFSYKMEHVRLVSRQRVEMLVPRSDPVSGYHGQRGCWCELRDADGRTIFRRVLHNAIRSDVEAPSDLTGHPMTRRPVKKPEGIFVVLVPDLDEAHTVAISNSPLQPEDAFRPAREIAHFPVKGHAGEGGGVQ